LTAFTIAADGSLVDRRRFAQLAGLVPDGICLDESGAVWVASPISHAVVRVAEGGVELERVDIDPDRQPFACMLGGPDRRTLFVCTAPTFQPAENVKLRQGRIEVTQVSVPGAGWP
jgi:sugar lactone lactonase YvrE